MKKPKRLSPYGVTVGTLLGIYVASIIIMFLWAINSSLKTVESFDFDTVGITKDFAFSNYIAAFFNGFKKEVPAGEVTRWVYIEEMFLNSLLYAGGGALCQTWCTCVVAYLTAKYDNPFSRLLHNVIIVTMILPIVGALPSQVQIMDFLHLRNTMVGMWIMKFGFTNIYYLIFYGAFKSISWGYAEAAIIDGANHFQVFFKVMLPLVKSLMGVVFLVFFIEYWNDYQTPMLFLDDQPVLSLGLFEFFKSYDQELSTPVVKIAGGVIVLMPLLVLFMIFKDKLMGNLTEGGIKS